MVLDFVLIPYRTIFLFWHVLADLLRAIFFGGDGQKLTKRFKY
jgi:hypothetical protein